MRQLVVFLAVVLLGLASYSELSSAVQRGGVAPGRYEIQVATSGKALDLRGEDKRTVQQWSRSGGVNQLWDIERANDNYYYIRSAETGAYLAVDGAGNGARVSAADRGNRASHVWRIEDEGNGQVRITHRSGLSLDVPNGVADDGTPMQVWSPARQPNQVFRLVPAGNTTADAGRRPYASNPNAAQTAVAGAGFSGPGQYEIESAVTGKVLDLRREDFRTVQQWERGGVKNQRWNIEDAGSGYYYIRSAETGTYLGIEGTGNGARVVATQRGNRNSNIWRIEDMGNGLATIVHRSGLVLDLHNGVADNGQAMQVWGSSRQPNQQFKLIRVGNIELDTSAGANPNTNDPNYRDRPVRGERIVYDTGYQAGVDDNRAGLGRNYRRHRERYDRTTEIDFQTGYNAGYDSVRSAGTTATRPAYEEGFQAGASDSRAALNRNYRRHRERYDRNTEADFLAGYNAGYDSTRNDSIGSDDLSRMTATERRYYDDGYRSGQDDARGGYSSNYRRFSSRYNRQYEPFFQRGYEAGYNSIRR